MIENAEKYLLQYHSSQGYLRLSRVYAAYLGGLRWSSTEDALVYADGRFFAFSEAIAEFVDGFMSQGRVPAFGYLLHWMDLLQNQRDLANSSVRRLRSVFFDTGGNWRNAGAFAGSVSDNVPEVPEPPDAALLGKRLRDRSFPIRWFVSQFHEAHDSNEQPPVPPGEFEAAVIAKLDAYGNDDLKAWLRSGRGPIKHAERLAEHPPVPRSLARVLASLLERPRLAGAETYVAQLVGALALPPRRMTPQELPVGGYTDIVTRGQVEQLLPTQFALDDLEFLRRFAEKELLYFRREEPPFQNRQELVVLLDQGVRTWGDVRLVLAGAAVAFGKQALLRKTPFFLAATSNGGVLVDPLHADEEAIGRLIEASDLTLNPGLALERVLESMSDEAPLARSASKGRPLPALRANTAAAALRDVVLLTHPRSLREADVLAAARRLGPRDRLFATTLDGRGEVGLYEVRHGAPIPVRQFHVDFAPSLPKPQRPPQAVGVSGPAWQGDVEAIPYPFRIGTEPLITHFDFDYGGQWLLTVSGAGSLHLWKLDGTTHEMIPRPCRGTVMKDVLAVIGVAGGFAIAGKIGTHLMLAHYDTVKRRIDLYDLGPCYYRDEVPLDYDRSRRAIVINAGRIPVSVVDLRLGAAIPISDASDDAALAKTLGEPPSFVRRVIACSSNYSAHATPAPDTKRCRHDEQRGSFTLLGVPAEPVLFTPIANGKPCFTLAGVREVQLAREIMALRAERNDIGDSVTCVRLPDGAILREYPLKRPKHKILQTLLSFDGDRIALQRSDHRIEVDAIRDRSLPTVYTRAGGFSMEARLFVGRHCVLLNLGSSRQYWHLFNWDTGRLKHSYQRARVSTNDPLPSTALTIFTTPPRDGPLLPGGPIRPQCCAQDPDRYVAGVLHKRLWFVLDRFGQVAILDEDETPIAMLIAFRDRFAAWLPDGTCFGAYSNSAPTDGAAEKIGQALLGAEAPNEFV